MASEIEQIVVDVSCLTSDDGRSLRLTLTQAQDLISKLQTHINRLDKQRRLEQQKRDGKKWLKQWLGACTNYDSYSDNESDQVHDDKSDQGDAVNNGNNKRDQEPDEKSDQGAVAPTNEKSDQDNIVPIDDNDSDVVSMNENERDYRDLCKYVIEYCNPLDFKVKKSYEVRKRSTHVDTIRIRWLAECFNIIWCSVEGGSWFETLSGSVSSKYKDWKDIKTLSISELKELIAKGDWERFKAEMTTYMIRHGFHNMEYTFRENGLFVKCEDGENSQSDESSDESDKQSDESSDDASDNMSDPESSDESDRASDKMNDLDSSTLSKYLEKLK